MVVVPFVKMSATTLFVLPRRLLDCKDYPEEIRLSCRPLLVIANPCYQTLASADRFERMEQIRIKKAVAIETRLKKCSR